MVGPNGPSVRFKSWQTVGSTVALGVAAPAVAAGTANAAAAARPARAASGFLHDMD
jgi:hypothetical protein